MFCSHYNKISKIIIKDNYEGKIFIHIVYLMNGKNHVKTIYF